MLVKKFKFNCTDYYRSKYLNNCDLLNKFMFKSTKLFPCVNKITLNFSLKNFILLSVASTKSKDIKSILFFILFFSKIPYIFFKSLESKSNVGFLNEQNGEYSLKVLLSSAVEIQFFLFSFFYEHYFFFIQESLFSFSKKKLTQKMSLYTMFVPLNSLIAFLDCFNSVLTQVNVRDSFIQVNFTLLKKSKQQIDPKNVLFFWINESLDSKYKKQQL